MERTGGDVEEFVAAVTPARRQRDAHTLIDLMRKVTGEEPVLWTGNTIGFGQYHYEYATGRSGDAGAAGFAPRKAASTIYLPDGTDAHAAALARLGKHTSSLVCLYITDLDAVDLDVLREIIDASYRAVTAGTFATRPSDGTSSS